jgi:hypothetical protein
MGFSVGMVVCALLRFHTPSAKSHYNPALQSDNRDLRHEIPSCIDTRGGHRGRKHGCDSPNTQQQRYIQTVVRHGVCSGVGGSAQSVREYLALPDRNRIRYITDHPIKCQISDEGRASGCTGITDLQHEQVSVYDDSDSVTTAVTARVELDQGTYPVIIVVPKQDLQCGE